MAITAFKKSESYIFEKLGNAKLDRISFGKAINKLLSIGYAEEETNSK